MSEKRLIHFGATGTIDNDIRKKSNNFSSLPKSVWINL